MATGNAIFLGILLLAALVGIVAGYGLKYTAAILFGALMMMVAGIYSFSTLSTTTWDIFYGLGFALIFGGLAFMFDSLRRWRQGTRSDIEDEDQDEADWDKRYAADDKEKGAGGRKKKKESWF